GPARPNPRGGAPDGVRQARQPQAARCSAVAVEEGTRDRAVAHGKRGMRPRRIPLELTGLTKTFQTAEGPVVAVDNVNAAVNDGEFVCILGHSGCGKSTLLSIIAGLQRATLGGVLIDGKEVTTPGSDRA